MIPEIIGTIENMIITRFPSVNIIIDKISDTDEYFIVIDDKDLYESNDYLMLVTEISLNILLKNGVTNVFFSYTSPQNNTDIARGEIDTWVYAYTPGIDDVRHNIEGAIIDQGVGPVWISYEKYLTGSEVYNCLSNSSLTLDTSNKDNSPNLIFHKNHSYEDQTHKFTIDCESEDNDSIKLAA